MDKTEYITVSLLTQYLQRKFDYDPYLQKVYLVGEISNFRERPSHQYFSLKDDNAKISTVMFASAYKKLKFKPEEGMKVFVTGHVTLYGPSGSYQINIDTMEPDGIGALYQAYEQLKTKLAAEGLFNQPEKPFVKFPQKIAVVTSQSGAVIRDIITTAKRRYPQAQVILFPAVVQGDQAKYSLVDAMKKIKQIEDQFDVLIIGRGGGSIEDLWPFNEEMVVRQIAEMNLPVISSVGHETDVTLSDLVADKRAATPTAAAELATPNLVDELIKIQKMKNSIFNRMNELINQRQIALNRVNDRVIMREPNRMFERQMQTFDRLKSDLLTEMNQVLQIRKNKYDILANKLNGRILNHELKQLHEKNQYLTQMIFDKMKVVLERKRHQETLIIRQLDELSPLKILSRGYVYTTDKNDKVVTSINQVMPEQELNLHFVDGQVQSVIKSIREENRGS